jgi:hypothetical protein
MVVVEEEEEAHLVLEETVHLEVGEQLLPVVQQHPPEEQQLQPPLFKEIREGAVHIQDPVELLAAVVALDLAVFLQPPQDHQTPEQEGWDGIQCCLHLHMELQDQLRDIDIFLAAVVVVDSQVL